MNTAASHEPRGVYLQANVNLEKVDGKSIYCGTVNVIFVKVSWNLTRNFWRKFPARDTRSSSGR